MLPQLLALQLASLKNCGRGTVGSWKVPSAITVEGIVFTPKGAFVIKDVTSGKKLLEITPRKLVRVARPTQGRMITRQPVLDRIGKEGGASSPS